MFNPEGEPKSEDTQENEEQAPEEEKFKFNEYSEPQEGLESETKEEIDWDIEQLGELIESEESGDGYEEFQRDLDWIEGGKIFHSTEKRPFTDEEKQEERQKTIDNHQKRVDAYKAQIAELQGKLKKL